MEDYFFSNSPHFIATEAIVTTTNYKFAIIYLIFGRISFIVFIVMVIVINPFSCLVTNSNYRFFTADYSWKGTHIKDFNSTIIIQIINFISLIEIAITDDRNC